MWSSSKKPKIKTKDVKVYRGSEYGSDHFLLRRKIIFPIKYNNKNQEKTTQNGKKFQTTQYNIESLGNDKLSEHKLQETPRAKALGTKTEKTTILKFLVKWTTAKLTNKNYTITCYMHDKWKIICGMINVKN